MRLKHVIRFHVIVIIVVVVIALPMSMLRTVFFIVRIANNKMIHRGFRRKKFLGAICADPLRHFGAI